MTHQWYAVRCCCDGNKVLGFIYLPQDRTQHEILQRGEGLSSSILVAPPSSLARINRHVVEMKMFGDEWSVYSDDRGIEFWRTINGFVEAK